MDLINDSIAKLSKKASRIIHYVGCINDTTTFIKESDRALSEELNVILEHLKCEGSVPSHTDVYFLFRFFDSDQHLNRIGFLNQHFAVQLDKIHNEMVRLYSIDSKCKGGDVDGAVTSPPGM